MTSTSRLPFLAVTALALTLASVAAYAAAPVIPESTEPSRATQQIAPQASPQVEPSSKVTSTPPAAAPKGAEKVKFTLKSVTIADATVYSEATLKRTYEGMIGHEVSLADVYGLAAKLTAKYRNDGYILTQVVVPPQTIESGNIKLRVVEGFIDKVNFQGKTRANEAWLQGFADKLRATKPLNSKDLERYVLIMNDISGLSAKAVLSPSQTPGASDVTVIVEQKPYDVSAEVDNRGSRYLGPFQFNTSGRVNNAFGLYEGLSLQIATAPNNWPHRDLDFGAISWSQPLNHEGTTAKAQYSITSTHPGFTLTPFDVQGTARAVDLSVTHPFIRSRQENLSGDVKFDYLDSLRSDNLGLGTTQDRLSVIRAGGTFQIADALAGVNTVTTELSKGIDAFGITPKGSAGLSRAQGDPLFFKGTAEISRLQRLADKWDLFVTGTGQKSATPLLASEQFGLGGASYGSAYDSSELTGDDGLAGRAELRFNNPLNLPVSLLQLYGFYDIGKVWDPTNSTASLKMPSLADAGAGWRVNFNENFSGSFEWAMPLTRDVATQNSKAPRYFGSLAVKF